MQVLVFIISPSRIFPHGAVLSEQNCCAVTKDIPLSICHLGKEALNLLAGLSCASRFDTGGSFALVPPCLFVLKLVVRDRAVINGEP